MTEFELKEEDLTQSYVRYKWKFFFAYITWNLLVGGVIIIPYYHGVDTIDWCGLGLAAFIVFKLALALVWYILYYIKNGY